MNTAQDLGLVTCVSCARVWPQTAGHCARCGYRLRPVDRRRLQWVWALWLTGLIAYIPANLYPMLVTSTLTSQEVSTIIGGAIEIAKHGDYALSLIHI